MMKATPIELSKQVVDARYFSFSNRKGASRVPVNIFFGGLEHCREDYRINRKGFPVHLMEYVEDGVGELVLGGERHALRKGCFFFYGPGIPCKILNDAERPLVKYFFAFHCRGPALAEIRRLDRLFFGPGHGGGLVGDLVRLLFNEACSPGEGSWRICCYYLDVILLKTAQGRLAEQFHRERAWEVFNQVKEYIEDNYLELRRMDDIADAVGLDASYISRLFKRYYHLTPYNFLLKNKMEHALDILRQGSTPVQEAAREVGFEDPFHFSRVFKRFKGISPSEVRG
ncbi:MAG: AraC family transcriptional regulator [Oceanipulchritudo sp.]